MCNTFCFSTIGYYKMADIETYEVRMTLAPFKLES
jgi:hypothetical protein